jgi:DNA polymerase-3 subunit alpha
MGPIEELGLLKMDFLGLSNLTIIKNALRIISKVYQTEIDINTIPLDDGQTFELLQRGDTTGVFQFESSGMKRYLRELKATEFDDVIAMGALYRPGPLIAGLTYSFIKRKNGLEPVSFAHPLMESALGTTYGVLVYQEQVMQISRDVCGFTGGEADTLRKAIGKKKVDVMNKMQIKFEDGAVENGVPRPVIEKFWKDLLGFADYCFNKSHSACYGLISYQTAYLKAHFPAAYMAALMTSDFDDTDRLSIEISECKKMGIQVLPPDVNESYVEFAVVPGEKLQIRFGMAAIKNVGTAAVEEIIRARTENGSFETLEDFLGTVNSRTVNKKAIESLIKAGAFDRFGDRSTLLANMDVMTAYSSRLQKQMSSGQTDIFGNSIDDAEIDVKPKLALSAPITQYDVREQLVWERELLGLYLSQNPLELFEHYLAEQTIPLNSIKPEHDGKNVTIGGAIADIREIVTKKGQKMAFVKLEDQFGETEIILFPSSYQLTAGIWERDKIVLARGKVSAKDRDGNISSEIKILVNDAREITTAQAQAYESTGKKIKGPGARGIKNATKPVPQVPKTETVVPKRLYIRLDAKHDQTLLLSLKQAIDGNTGPMDVVLVLGPDTEKQVIKLPSGIEHSEKIMNQLQTLVGVDNVKIH